MANLLGQNIGTNYKGILNLNTLNGNLSGTLQAVTDGDGNASPLQLSTTQVSNVFTGSHTILWRANGTLTDYSGWHQNDGTFVILKKDGNPLWFNIDSGINFSGGFGSTGRSTINSAGNWNIGGSFTNAARLHVRGDGTNPIILLQNGAGTATRFQIDNDGNCTGIDGFFSNYASFASGSNGIKVGSGLRIKNPADGNILLQNDAANGFNLIQLGGTTNAFPALKRNGAALEVRLADDSANASLNAAAFNTASCNIGSNFIAIGGDSGFLRPAASTLAISLNGFSNNHFEFRKNSDTTVVGIIKGTGSPEGVITANQGSIFLRTDGGAGTSFYVKESGTGNTGWVAK